MLENQPMITIDEYLKKDMLETYNITCNVKTKVSSYGLNVELTYYDGPQEDALYRRYKSLFHRDFNHLILLKITRKFKPETVVKEFFKQKQVDSRLKDVFCLKNKIKGITITARELVLAKLAQQDLTLDNKETM